MPSLLESSANFQVSFGTYRNTVGGRRVFRLKKCGKAAEVKRDLFSEQNPKLQAGRCFDLGDEIILDEAILSLSMVFFIGSLEIFFLLKSSRASRLH